MYYSTISTSEGRKNLPKLIREVDESGCVYVFTIHGKAKAAMIDLGLFEQFIENVEYGISEKELLKRSKEPRIDLEEFKKKFNV